MELRAIPTGASIPQASIQVRGNALQINLPRSLFSDHKQKRIMSGLPNTDEGRARAEQIVEYMNVDMMQGVFDYSLLRYNLPKTANKENHLRLVEYYGGSKSKNGEELSLKELWDKYLEYRKGTLQETTFVNTWVRIYTRLIENIPATCKDALQVRSYIIDSTTPIYQNRLLAVLSRCYEWGMKHKLVGSNPYLGMAEEIKPVRAKKHVPKSVELLGLEYGDDDYRAFSSCEMDAIIHAFESAKKRSHWAPFVKFLFWSGCRPGEALALKWKHVSSDFRVITIEDSFGLIQNSSASYISKGTKTGKSRKFRLNEGGKLYSLLKDIKPEGAKLDDFVFTSPSGGNAKWSQFVVIWHGNLNVRASGNRRNYGVIPALIQQGLVQAYLKPYAMRHTYITLSLAAGANIADIAKQVGNSPTVIMQSYASATRDLALPEI